MNQVGMRLAFVTTKVKIKGVKMENNRTEKVLTLHMDKAYRAKIENSTINENDFF